MPRYIDADEFQKAIEEKAKRLKNLDTINGLCGAIPILYEQPTADVQPVIHAQWLGTEIDGYSDGFPVYSVWKCSNCGAEFECEDMDFHYCPRCGAYMDKESKDEFC